MDLIKIADFYPNYKQDIFGGEDIKGYGVYTEGDEKVGEVHDALLDDTGRFRYLVIDTGFWIFGKKVLLPVGRAMMDYNQRRVYVTGLTKEQAENLPEYNDNMAIDYNYEERVRDVYRTPGAVATTTSAQPQSYTSADYSYEREPALYGGNGQNNHTLKLYEEKLIANKQRHKTGEVAVGKRVETETAQVSVPIEKERVVIERMTPTNVREVTPGEVDFREGEVARVEVYEESADIQKKAFVREEVSVRKEVERDTVNTTDTIRREELQVDVDGKPVVHQSP